ncbi:MAG TPA: hypothetical protein VK507_22095 [Iamia sp.]|nr:hypothetical protein [Iamia sp.]
MAVLALGVAGCGRDDEPVDTAQEGEATGPVAAANALEGTPLPQLLGSPVATDEASLWYSDFDQLARRDLATGRWDVSELPFDQSISSLGFVSDGAGGLKGLAGLCEDDGGCDEGVISEVGAWRVTADGEPERVELEVPVPLSDVGGNVYFAPVTDGESTVFRVANGTGTILVRWADAPQAEAVDRAFATLCPDGDGFVGVEDDTTSGQALAPKTVVAGPGLRDLAPVEADPAVDRLLDGIDGAASCLADGLAVVGPDEAWELQGGRWTAVPSDVGQPLQRQMAGALPVVDRSGTLAHAGTVLNISRDDRGWHTLAVQARPSSYGLIGGELMTYPADYEVPFDPATQGADPAEGEPVPDGEGEGG